VTSKRPSRLAVWLCMAQRSVGDKILAIVFRITAFIAGGFEHFVANMYFLPDGGGALRGDRGSAWNFRGLGQLLLITIINILGGTVLVAFVYWSVCLRGNAT